MCVCVQKIMWGNENIDNRDYKSIHIIIYLFIFLSLYQLYYINISIFSLFKKKLSQIILQKIVRTTSRIFPDQSSNCKDQLKRLVHNCCVFRFTLLDGVIASTKLIVKTLLRVYHFTSQK